MEQWHTRLLSLSISHAEFSLNIVADDGGATYV